MVSAKTLYKQDFNPQFTRLLHHLGRCLFIRDDKLEALERAEGREGDLIPFSGIEHSDHLLGGLDHRPLEFDLFGMYVSQARRMSVVKLKLLKVTFLSLVSPLKRKKVIRKRSICKKFQ